MTQAFNLSQLANNLDTSGRLDATDGLVNAVPVANGGTGASTDAAARTNLNVPTRTGADASGTWGISISGNAATATSATSATTATNATFATTAGNGGVTSVNGLTGAVTVNPVPSSFDAVGSTLLALNISTSNLLPGNTIAGANLAYVSGVQSWSSVITIFSGSVTVTTLGTSPKSLLGGVGQSGNGNPGWQSMPNTTTLPGTWRVLFLGSARQYVFDSEFNQYFQQAYFVLVQRIS